jgi:hypothetical protein
VCVCMDDGQESSCMSWKGLWKDDACERSSWQSGGSREHVRTCLHCRERHGGGWLGGEMSQEGCHGVQQHPLCMESHTHTRAQHR